MFKLSPHIDLDPSPTLGINERVRELWEADKTVYHFGFGESRFPVHPLLQRALSENAHRKSYLPVQGLAPLREAVAAYYGAKLGITASPKQVMISPGSKAMLFAIQMALDADLLLPTPSWVSYAPQAQMLGQHVYQIPATAVSDYQLTIPALTETVAKADDGQKLLIINTPSNPTGAMLSAEFLQKLADFCRQHQIFVISDEIYGFVPHGSRPHVSLAQFYPEGTAVLGGLSKHLSLGGWRLGHAILPATAPELMQAVIKIGSEIWSSPSAPVQYAAITAYENNPEIEAYIADCAAIHAARTKHLWSWFQELGIRCTQPEGGFYLTPNFDRWREPLAAKGVTTSTELATYLLENHRIATLPAAVFGVPPTELSLRVATNYIDMEDDAAANKLLNHWQAHRDAAKLMQQHPQMDAAVDQLKQFVTTL
ncbi:MAG: aminotransferase class I/II-fold pyridoxal phosphate-dependent enzyme [Chloroflexota bacterium]